MAAEYLKEYRLGWTYPVQNFGIFYGASERLTRSEFISDMNFKVMALWPLFDLIWYRLRKAKVHTKPKLTHIETRLAFFQSSPMSWTLGEPHQLIHEYYVHPIKFLEMPNDAQVLGELAISIVRHLLDQLQSKYEPIEGVPVEVFEESMSYFRENEYIVWSGGKLKDVYGTKLKFQMFVGASGAETSRIFVLKYRGEKLFERQLEPVRAGLHRGRDKCWVEIEDDGLKIAGIQREEMDYLIPFDEMPTKALSYLKP